jgi:hypothetical protein
MVPVVLKAAVLVVILSVLLVALLLPVESMGMIVRASGQSNVDLVEHVNVSLTYFYLGAGLVHFPNAVIGPSSSKPVQFINDWYCFAVGKPPGEICGHYIQSTVIGTDSRPSDSS